MDTLEMLLEAQAYINEKNNVMELNYSIIYSKLTYKIPHNYYRMETLPFTWQQLKGMQWLLSVLCTEMQTLL